MVQFLTLLEKFGLPMALSAILIAWAYQKDKRQEKRYDNVCGKINEVQGEQRKELLDISVRAVAAQSEATAVQKETTAVQKELVAELRQRPCIARNQ